MRRLGQALGVEAMSLYKHVVNKEDLLGGMVDFVVAEVVVPQEAENWQAAMRARALSAHEVLRHPWATALMGSRLRIGPGMLRYLDQTLGWLRRGGFSVPLDLEAWHALDSHIYGFTLQALNLPFRPQEAAQMAEAFLPQIPSDLSPSFLEVASAIMVSGHRERFEFGLDLLLDGLERLRGRQATAAGPEAQGS